MNVALIKFVLLVSLVLASGKQLHKRQNDCYANFQEQCLPWIEDYSEIRSIEDFVEKIHTDGVNTTCINAFYFTNCFYDTYTAEGCPGAENPEGAAEIKKNVDVVQYLCVDDFDTVDELFPCLTGEELFDDASACVRDAHEAICQESEVVDCIRRAVTYKCSEEGGKLFDKLASSGIFYDNQCTEPWKLKSLFKFV